MKSKNIIQILKFCCFLIFAGRAYQHLFWDAPFRSFLWDQELLEPVINTLFNLDWREYVTNLKYDQYIQTSIRVNGFFYLTCAILSLIIQPVSKQWIKILLFLGGVSLVFLSMLLTKEKFYHFPMFFEHAIQFGSPFVLLYFLKKKQIAPLLLSLKILIAAAFTCHGLYAIGSIYPLPAIFVTMTLNILPVTEPVVKQLLLIAGVLDFIIAIGIFIPKISKPFLIYAAFWGIITALARTVSSLKYGGSADVFHQYLFETIYRLPHGIIPLLVYLISRKEKHIVEANNAI